MGSLRRGQALGGVRLGVVIGGLVLALGSGAPTGWARPLASVPRPAPAPARGLRVIPFPGTPDASPSSTVIFSALRPSDLRWLTVTGSRSGRHTGRVELLPANAGTAFVPYQRFAPGETVRVQVRLSSGRAGTASGDPGANELRYSFRVAAPVNEPGPAAPDGGPPASWLAYTGSAASSKGYGSTQSFHSAPNLHPPVLQVTADPDRTSGDMFLGALYSPQEGPMILNARGQLVWFDPHHAAVNFAVQHYQGHPVLTWWQGVALGPGHDVIMDASYHRLAVVRAGDGYHADLHEFQITRQNTALIDVYLRAPADLTSVGGPKNGTVLDCAIQEIDIKTGQVLWEWHAMGHVPLSASYAPVPTSSSTPYDFFHLNSIQQLPGGNLLVSARNTWAVYEISRQTGKVIWTLGGKDSNFRMLPGTNFEWQHDARLQHHTLSLMDNADWPQEEPQSSAKLLLVDDQTRTVSLIHRYTHSPPLLNGVTGGAQLLASGNIFVGWGIQPDFSEYTPGGKQIFNGSFALGVSSYRAFRFPWVGRPDTRPSLAVSRVHGHTKIYVSWNGATEVTAWRVLGGPRRDDLKRLGLTASLTGFETEIGLPSGPRYVAVQALDSRGEVLKTSAPARG